MKERVVVVMLIERMLLLSVLVEWNNFFIHCVTLVLKQIAPMDGPESWELTGFIIDSTAWIIAGSIR